MANGGPLTQTVEYLPFKQRVAGSSPARPTIGENSSPMRGLAMSIQTKTSGAAQPPVERPHRLARPRTPAFHAGDRGSNPLGDAKIRH